MRRGPILFPLVLIGLGILFLLSNFNVIQFDFWQFIGTWWPLILVIVGLDILIGSFRARNIEPEVLSLDLGSATQADVSVSFGAGELTVGRSAPGKIVDGTFEGGLRYDAKPDGRVWLKSDPDGWWWGWGTRGQYWKMGLTGDVPLKLKLDGGASSSQVDLTELKVTDLNLSTGAASTTVRLPRAAGLTNVRISAGMASVKLIVPEGVAARIHTKMGLGSNDVDQRRFPRSGDDYISPDYATAPNKVDIRCDGGLGSLAVV